MTGILLWNMRDGWLAYNSSLVDFYGRKKLSYYYVKQSQQPLVFIMDDSLKGYVCNDSLKEYQGEYRIYDGLGKLLQSGDFCVGSNQNAQICDFSGLKNEKYLILELRADNRIYYNHFINEKRVHDFEHYKKFLSVYTEKSDLQN